MKGNYRAFLFDLDGTLVDSAPDIGAALNHSLAAAGLSTVGDKLVRHWVGYGSRTLIRQALEYHHQDISDDLIEQLLTPFLEYYTEHITDLSQVYPGVHEVLGRLRNDGHPLGVVTNKLTQLTQPVLAGVALADYFSVVVCGDTTNNPKPAAAPILYALEALGAQVNESLMVGDSATDVNAAKAAGVDVACVSYGYNHGVDVATLEPTTVLASFDEICKLI